MEDTPTPPSPPGPSTGTMDVPSMLSIMEGAGYDISRLRSCRGTRTVSQAYKNFCAYRESQSLAIVAHSPSKEMTKEMATANPDDGVEKEEESAGGRYVFMYLLILGKLLTLFLDSQLRNRVAVVPKDRYVMNNAVWSMLTVLISFSFYSVVKRKDADRPTKKAKATDPPTKKAKATDHPPKKAKAAGLSSQAKAVGVEVITKKILKYVAFGITSHLAMLLTCLYQKI
jgi:hypothetical protein